MEDWWLRVSHNLNARLDGPLHFRFIMQPLMSIVLAVRDGLRDARKGDQAYLWFIFRDRHRRPELLRTGLKSIRRLFFLAIGVDTIYQVIAFRTFYPGEALLAAVLLAIVPYVLLRGPINRLEQLSSRHKVCRTKRVECPDLALKRSKPKSGGPRMKGVTNGLRQFFTH